MKKLTLIFSLLLLMLAFCSCDNTADTTKVPDTEPETTQKASTDTLDADKIKKEYYIEKKDGAFEYVAEGSDLQLKLPSSSGNATIDVRKEAAEYLHLIDYDLYTTAINDFFRQIKQSEGLVTNYPLIEIKINENNFVSMYMECIVHYDPPHTDTYGEVREGGCGYDHDHIQIWDRAISHKKIK